MDNHVVVVAVQVVRARQTDGVEARARGGHGRHRRGAHIVLVVAVVASVGVRCPLDALNRWHVALVVVTR